MGFLQLLSSTTPLPSFSVMRLSSSHERNAFVPSAYNSSRRLALVHLAAVIPQSQLFGANAIQLPKLDGDAIGTRKDADSVSNSTATEENLLEWPQNDKRRMLHAVYRVGDLEKTIKFYTECLGMKLLRKRDMPEERYSNAFVGYGPEESHFAIELTYNYGVNKYDIGTGFGYFSIAVDDVAKTVDLVKAKGGNVAQGPGLVRGRSMITAFVEDPTGYKFELLERVPKGEPLCKMMLHVGDLERSINFYRKAFGMGLLQRRDEPDNRRKVALMGYGPEEQNVVLELTSNYGIKEYDKGNGYAQIAISTNDVYKTAEAIRLSGGEITREPGPLPVINTKITACLDPDGWKTVFVDNIDFLKELK